MSFHESVSHYSLFGWMVLHGGGHFFVFGPDTGIILHAGGPS